jgi:hypothetical protein
VEHVSGQLTLTAARPGERSFGEPIIAWRVWTLRAHRHGLAIRPIAGTRRPWPALQPARAVCGRGRRHDVPGVHCTCGLYATTSPDLLLHARDPAVAGTVALWGRVVEHEHGYRAEFAYPQRLMLVCCQCFWIRGTGGSIPGSVARLRGGRLVPLCEQHVELCRRYGYPIRRLLPASDVEHALLSTYAVDVLRTSLRG